MKPQQAVILAAGFGMRMVPINTEVPKGLLEVHGESLIERIIKQLHEAGVYEIYVVVGFMKERYEYLVNAFGVKLVDNPEYATKNNLYTLSLAKDHLRNAYVIPCDIWCNRNPFNNNEMHSWYMVSDQMKNRSPVRVDAHMKLSLQSPDLEGNTMIGIAFLNQEDAAITVRKLEELCRDCRFDNAFWEETLYDGECMSIDARVVRASDVIEINTYEQLRVLDRDSVQLKTDAIQVICEVMNVNADAIEDIAVLKTGMTNRSFLFCCRGKKYIMRIPGEGTEKLINREEEAEVYHIVNGKKICDTIAYINPKNGYKITEFLEGAHVCNPSDYDSVKKCMKLLRKFHDERLKVKHVFDIFEKIEFYESLWEGKASGYIDYKQTKKNVYSLKPYIDEYAGERILTHIDAVPDNFLFVEENGKEKIRLIDWEYAGMQDPHVDVAMFGIYAMYNKQQMDRLIDAYFEDSCDNITRIKIYCYISACGLLWSNWCEYKRNLGVEFGEYSLCQYQYAKDYYQIAKEGMKKLGANENDT